jgi:hypothetical protein
VSAYEGSVDSPVSSFRSFPLYICIIFIVSLPHIFFSQILLMIISLEVANLDDSSSKIYAHTIGYHEYLYQTFQISRKYCLTIRTPHLHVVEVTFLDNSLPLCSETRHAVPKISGGKSPRKSLAIPNNSCRITVYHLTTLAFL